MTIVAAALIPIRLLDPGWQLRLGAALINSAPLPLTGLALLHLAAFLDVNDPPLQARRTLAASLAIPVAIGFLLLSPLLGTAAVRQQAEMSLQRSAGLIRATNQLQELREAVRSASSVEELHLRLQTLQGPQLEAADLSLPLPVVRERVRAVLDQSAAQIARAKGSLPPTANAWILLSEILRTTVACLALTVGFAGLGRRSSAEVSFLTEVTWSWQRWQSQLRTRRRSPGPLPHHDHLKSLAPKEPPRQ